MIEIKNFERYEFFKSFSEGFANPFITIFALTLGASNFLIGLLSSSVKLAFLISQLVFSFLLLKFQKKEFLLFTSTIFWSLMWIPIGFSKTPYELIAFLSIQAIFSALITLSWTELLVNLIPSYKKGEIIGKLNWWGALGSISATLASGYVLTNYGFIPFVFFTTFAFGGLASLNFLSLKAFFPLPSIPNIGFRKSLSEIRKNREFLKLLSAKLFFSFAVGIAAPFFAIYVVKGLGGSLMDVAAISVTSMFSHILFYKPWGLLVDRIGRKDAIISCILFIATLPLGYAFARNVFHVYLFAVLAGIGWSGFNVATFAYFSDVAERKNVFQLTGLYNSSIGISEMTANLLGGIIATSFDLFTVFLFSFILRLLATMLFLGLEERKGSEVIKFKTTLDPLHFIEVTSNTYLLLFSTFKKTTFERILHEIYKLFKNLVRKIIG